MRLPPLASALTVALLSLTPLTLADDTSSRSTTTTYSTTTITKTVVEATHTSTLHSSSVSKGPNGSSTTVFSGSSGARITATHTSVPGNYMGNSGVAEQANLVMVGAVGAAVAVFGIVI
ncbi:MAG: hypothetical protein Q9227_001145 [Pyrenula ochraceoflavens]